ncbi:MAG: pectate lyase family protein, partial [Victivallaceae bacterium]
MINIRNGKLDVNIFGTPVSPVWKNVAIRSILIYIFTIFNITVAEQPSSPTLQVVNTSGGKTYCVRIDAISGTNITERLLEAVDLICGNGSGGTIVLPPGNYIVSQSINLAGSQKRFPTLGPSGLELTGSGGALGTTINYRGPEGSTVIDMPGPNGCIVRNLTIDANNTPGVVGIHYRGGYDRGYNGGKNNLFENLILRRMDVGVYIGDQFLPDLVGGTFNGVLINYVRVGVQVEGGNVAGMCFNNLQITEYNESGMKIIGHSSRRLRKSPDEPATIVNGKPQVVVNPNNGKEIFAKDVPPYVLKERLLRDSKAGEYMVGGGAPEVVIFGFNAHGADPSAWAIDTNFGWVRVYSARLEGPGGFFRKTYNLGDSRFADVFMDICSVSPGLEGNVIEYCGAGPLYLIGGVFEANIAVGQNTKVYSMGVKFMETESHKKHPGLIHPSFKLPSNSAIKRTGQQQVFPGRRGTYDKVEIAMPRNIGFVQIPGTTGMQIYELTAPIPLSVKVPAGANSVTVTLVGQQPDTNYHISVTPCFNTQGVWVSGKTHTGFKLNFQVAPNTDATVEVLIQRAASMAQKL